MDKPSIDILDMRIELLAEISDIQNNKVAESPYQHGLANGIALALATLQGKPYKPFKPKRYSH